MAKQDIPIADIPTVSVADLERKSSVGADQMRRAASETGFFYVDFRDSEPAILKDAQSVYALATKYFSQPGHVKQKDTRTDIRPSQDLGFKKSECDETFELSYDEMRAADMPPLSSQALQSDNIALLQQFSYACHKVCESILNTLDPSLLASHHRPDQSSDTGLKLISEPSLEHAADVGDWTHTDSGTLTLLFYEAWGLQMLEPSAQKWAWIPPRDGCAVVNVANALQRLSRDKYHSPKHRVTQPEDGAADRLYLSYFLRPASEMVA